MYRDLNQQLREKLQGHQTDFQQFKDQHPQFPSAQEETAEELIQQLQQQLQQWRSLLESLSEPVRRELEQLMDTNLEAELQAQRAELREFLDQLAEKKLTPQRYRFKGREEISHRAGARADGATPTARSAGKTTGRGCAGMVIRNR